MNKQTFLITGASDGIGAVYAARLARRGHDLILVARRADKLAALADQLRSETGVSVDVIAADLANPDDLARVEARLRTDDAITGLINNAGMAGETSFVEADTAQLTTLINLNILAVTRLTAAIAPRLAAKGSGAIINIGSVTSLVPDGFTATYPASKAYVLAFSEALQVELGAKGVRVQAVLPGATRTPIWNEEQLASLPAEIVMDVNDMVDAALTGFDAGEVVTIPALPDMADYDTYIAARAALRPNLSLARPAPRYLYRRRAMIFGLTIPQFTALHVAISLIAIAAGLIALPAFARGLILSRTTGIFLWTTLLTSLTGFLFPIVAFTPALGFGILSTLILVATFWAWYGRKLVGRAATIYVVTATLALYLNLFVLVVQSFLKVPALNALAPNGTEPPFAIAQGALLIAMVGLGYLTFKAARRRTAVA